LRQLSDNVSSPNDDSADVEEATVIDRAAVAGRITNATSSDESSPSRSTPAGPHFNVASRSVRETTTPKAG
jgi:hypothetical protein